MLCGDLHASLSKLRERMKEGKPGVLQSMQSQRVGHNLVTEQQQQMGRKSKKEEIYVYLWLIHFVAQQKLTQWYIATILQFLKAQTICQKLTLAIPSIRIESLSHCSL